MFSKILFNMSVTFGILSGLFFCYIMFVKNIYENKYKKSWYQIDLGTFNNLILGLCIGCFVITILSIVIAIIIKIWTI